MEWSLACDHERLKVSRKAEAQIYISLDSQLSSGMYGDDKCLLQQYVLFPPAEVQMWALGPADKPYVPLC